MSRVLVHTHQDERRALDASAVHSLHVAPGGTELRGAAELPLDCRPLGALMQSWAPAGFLRIHGDHAVNLAEVLEIRRPDGTGSWQLTLRSAPKSPLPVERKYLKALWKAFGEL